MDLTADQRRILLDVARQTIRTALRGPGDSGPVEQIPDDSVTNDPLLHQPAGCFVTLHTLANHRLRGCVGRLDSRDELIAAVVESAKSVLQDPRFVDYPVRYDDLPSLEIEITVICPLRPTTNCLDFEPLNEGIYLTINDRTGCFLPQVAREMRWGREELLGRLCTEKLGLPATAWQQPAARLRKFNTLLIGPEPFVI